MTIYIDVKKEDLAKLKIFERALTSGYDVNKSRFKKAIDWIFDTESESAVKGFTDKNINFDYPEYWGLPTSISKNLSGDEVDLIQEFDSDFSNYFIGEDAFGLKSPKKTSQKVIKVNLEEKSLDKIENKVTKFMFKHYWDKAACYEVLKENKKESHPTKKMSL